MANILGIGGIMDATATLSKIEAELRTAGEISPISARLKVSSKLMNEMDELYKPLLSDGTLYSKRWEEARAYGNLMHNARNQHSILHYRARCNDDIQPGAEIPEHISSEALNEFWNTIKGLLVSSIEVLRDANTKNIVEGVS
jgi:hypothetical protein